MANKKMTYEIGFLGNTTQLEGAIAKAVSELHKLSAAPNNKLTADLREASSAALDLATRLSQAYNTDTGKLDLTKFNQSLKNSGMSIEQYAQNLMKLGPQGQQTFLTIVKAVNQASVATKRANGLINTMWTSLKNVAKWQISSSVLMGFTSSLSSAYTYAQDLNESLNKIRIVTNASTEEMKKFAKQANEAAKALSTSTTKYTDASLIYYQQGLEGKEVLDRADVTIKLANVTNQTAQEVSDQMTAVWNNFYDGSKKLEYYADVLTALGAATASSTDEITTGLEKFAAIAETTGLSYEYAASALATVTATTRQSAEVVGTAFKTLFARIQDLELGETLEDGVDLGAYSEGLAKVGVNILDANGQLKDMDNILNELGARWNTLTKAEQVSLAQTVAGVRQYTQLIALMDNWSFFKENLAIAQGSEGTLQKQANIYAESWQGARDRVKAALEDIGDSLINEETFIKLDDVLTPVLSAIAKIIDGMGGMTGVITTLGALLLTIFGDKVAAGINNFGIMLKNAFHNGQAEALDLKTTINQIFSDLKLVNGVMVKEITIAQDLAKIEADKLQNANLYNQTIKEEINVHENILSRLGEEIVAIEKKRASAEMLKNELAATMFDDMNLNGQNGKLKSLNKAEKKIGVAAEQRIASKVGNLKTTDATTIQNQILAQGKAYGKVTTDLQNLTNIQAKYGEVSAENLGQYQEALKGAGYTTKNFGNTQEEMLNFLNKQRTTLNTNKNAFKEYGQALSALNIDPASFEAYANAITDLNIQFQNGKISEEQFNAELEKLQATMQKTSVNVGQLVTGLGSFAMGMVSFSSSLKSSIDAVGDDTMSLGDKIASLSSSAATALMMMPMAYQGLSKAISAVAKTSTAAAGPWAIAIMAVVTVLTTVITLVSKQQEKIKELEKERVEANKELREEVKANKELVKSLQELGNEYDKTGEGKDALREKAKEVAEAYDIEATALRKLYNAELDYNEVLEKAQEKQAKENEKLLSDTKRAAQSQEYLLKTAAYTGAGYRTNDNKNYAINMGTAGKQLEDNAMYRILQRNAKGSVNVNYKNDIFSGEDYNISTAYTGQGLIDLYDTFGDALEEYAEKGYDQNTSFVIEMQEWRNKMSEVVETYRELQDEIANLSLSVDLATQEKKVSTLEEYQEWKKIAIEELRNQGKTEDEIVKYIDALAADSLNSKMLEFNLIDSAIEDAKSKITDSDLADDFENIYQSDEYDKAAFGFIHWTEVTKEGFQDAYDKAKKFKDGIEGITEATKTLTKAQELLKTLNSEDIDWTELATNWDTKVFGEFADFYFKTGTEQIEYIETLVKLAFQQQKASARAILNVGQYLIDTDIAEAEKNQVSASKRHTDLVAEKQLWERVAESAWNREKEKRDYNDIHAVFNNSASETALRALKEGVAINPRSSFVKGTAEAMIAAYNKEYGTNLGVSLGVDNKFKIANGELETDKLDAMINKYSGGEKRTSNPELEEEDWIKNYLENHDRYQQVVAQEIEAADELNDANDKLNEAKQLNTSVIKEMDKAHNTLLATIKEEIQYYQKYTEEIAKNNEAQYKSLASGMSIEETYEGSGERTLRLDGEAVKALSETDIGKQYLAENFQYDEDTGYWNFIGEFGEAELETFESTAKRIKEINDKKLTDLRESYKQELALAQKHVEAIKKLQSTEAALTQNTGLKRGDEGWATLNEEQIKNTLQEANIEFDTIKEQYNNMMGLTGDAEVDKLVTAGTEAASAGVNAYNDIFSAAIGNTAALALSTVGIYNVLKDYFAEGEALTDEQLQKKIKEITENAIAKGQESTTKLSDYYSEKALQMANTRVAELQKLVDSIQFSLSSNTISFNELLSKTSEQWYKAFSEELKDIYDKLYDINRQLEYQERLLSRIESEIDSTFGLDKLNKYQDKIDSLGQSYDNLLKKQRLLYDKNDSTNLINQTFKELQEMGLKPTQSDNLDLTSYYEVAKQIKKIYQDKLENVGSDTAAKQEAEDWYKKAQDKVKEYSDYVDQYYEVEEQIRENLAAQFEAEIDKATYKVNLKIELEDIKKAAEDFGIEIAKAFGDALSNNQIDLFKNGGIISDQLNRLKNNNLLAEMETSFGELQRMWKPGADTEKLKEAMVEIQNQAISAGQELLEQVETIKTMLPDAIDAAGERLSFFNDQLERNKSLVSTFKELMTLQGVTAKTTDGYARLQKASETQMKSAVAIAKTQQKYADSLSDNIAEIETRMSQIVDKDSLEYSILEENYKALVEAQQEAYDAMYAAAKEAMEAAKEMYETEIEHIASAFENALTDGMGFDFVQQKYDYLMEKEEWYLDAVTERFEIEKWNNKLDKDILEANSTMAASRLQALKQEMELRRQNGKLSQYDLDIMQAKYDLTLAQIALDEAQNAKSKVRLVRNASGNWDYVFTSDQDAISEAENKVIDAEQNLYNITKEGTKEIMGEIVSFFAEVSNEITEVYKDTTLTVEQKTKKIAEIEQRALEKYGWYMEQYNIRMSDMTSVGINVLDNYSNQYGNIFDKIGLNTTNFQDTFQTMVDECEKAFGNYKTTIEKIGEETGTDLDTLTSKTKDVASASETMEQKAIHAIDTISGKIDDITSISNAFAGQAENILKAAAAYQQLANNIATYLSMNADSISGPEVPEVNTGGGFTGDYSLLYISKMVKGIEGGWADIIYQRNQAITASGKTTTDDYNEFLRGGILTTSLMELIGKYLSNVGGSEEHWKKMLEKYDPRWVDYADGLRAKLYSNEKINEYMKQLGIKFATGGYTGEFDDAKLAWLHEKELVLNQSDTQNILTAVESVRALGPTLFRQIEAIIDGNVVAGQNLMGARFGTTSISPAKQEIEQNVKIEAHFPGVQSAVEIEMALQSLVNDTAQYVSINQN